MTTRTCIALVAASALTTGSAHAFEVTALPPDNLVENPWFRSPGSTSSAGFGSGIWLRETWDGGTLLESASGDQRPPDSLTFGLSRKVTNPSPVQAPGCGSDPTLYCGTGARWAEDRGEGCSLDRVGLDAYARQIVAAGDPTHRRLRFSAWWVSHRIAVAEVNIAGAATANGPWIPLWTPLHVESPDVDLAATAPHPPTDDRSVEWRYLTCGTTTCSTAPVVETELAQGYAFYRIELHVRYPDLQQVTCQAGAKLTGVYFATAATTGGGGRERLDGGGAIGADDGADDGDDALADEGAGCSAAGAPSGSRSLAFLLAAVAALGLRRRSRRASV
jgi:MYXO-CTERM domain-containing protein